MNDKQSTMITCYEELIEQIENELEELYINYEKLDDECVYLQKDLDEMKSDYIFLQINMDEELLNLQDEYNDIKRDYTSLKQRISDVLDTF